MNNSEETTTNNLSLEELKEYIRDFHKISHQEYDAALRRQLADAYTALLEKGYVASCICGTGVVSFYKVVRKFRVQYTESGDGKMIKGRRYDGHKTVVIASARDEEQAIACARSYYTETGIKSIDHVEAFYE